jgi:molecular chaperone DnaK
MDFGEHEGQATFEVLATSGDTALGGKDMDQALIDFVTAEFKRETGLDLTTDKMAMNRVREAVEKAKIELSTTLETDLNLPFISADASGPKHLNMKLTRAKLEELVKPIVARMRQPVEQALRDAKLTPQQIDKIIMVGGPTRMPVVQKFVEDYIGKQVERGIDPMEAVAKGAAVQAGVLSGDVGGKEILLLDVTPLTLGLETLGGVATALIERNTTIPTSKTQTFSTAADNQTSVEINVVQGERPMATDNKSLGRFHLDGIPAAPRGVPQVEVTFDIDANGILKVTAKDKASGKSQDITITGSSNLSKEEVERMKKEAEMHAEEDRKNKETVEIRNQADTLISVSERTLKDAAGKAPEADIQEAQAKVDGLKAAKDKPEVDPIKKAMDELNAAIQKVGAAMYQSPGGAQAQQPGAQPGAEPDQGSASANASADGPVDAEYKDVSSQQK